MAGTDSICMFSELNNFLSSFQYDIDPHTVTPPSSPRTDKDLDSTFDILSVFVPPLPPTPPPNPPPPPLPEQGVSWNFQSNVAVEVSATKQLTPQLLPRKNTSNVQDLMCSSPNQRSVNDERFFLIAQQGTRPTKYHIKTECEYKGFDIFGEHHLTIDDLVLFQTKGQYRYGILKGIEASFSTILSIKERLEIMPPPYQIVEYPRHKRPACHRGIVSFVSSRKDLTRPTLASASKCQSVPLVVQTPKVSTRIPKKLVHPMSNLQIAWEDPSSTKNPQHWQLLQDILQLFAPITLAKQRKEKNCSTAQVTKVLNAIKTTFELSNTDILPASEVEGPETENIDVPVEISESKQKTIKPPNKTKRMRKLSSSSSSSDSSSSSSCSNSSCSNSPAITLNVPKLRFSSPKKKKSNNLREYDPACTYLMIDRLGISKEMLNELLGSTPMKTRTILVNILRIHPELQEIDWAETSVIKSTVVEKVRGDTIEWLLCNPHILNHQKIIKDSKETLMEAVRNMVKTAKSTKLSRKQGKKTPRTSAVEIRLLKWKSSFVYL